jgi:hypothetical protein
VTGERASRRFQRAYPTNGVAIARAHRAAEDVLSGVWSSGSGGPWWVWWVIAQINLLNLCHLLPDLPDSPDLLDLLETQK